MNGWALRKRQSSNQPSTGCRFRKEWLKNPEFRDWLAKGNSNDKARCMVCETELCAGKSELLRHSKGKKHKKKVELAMGRRISLCHSIKSNSSMEGSPAESFELSSVLDEDGISHVLVRKRHMTTCFAVSYYNNSSAFYSLIPIICQGEACCLCLSKCAPQ